MPRFSKKCDAAAGARARGQGGRAARELRAQPAGQRGASRAGEQPVLAGDPRIHGPRLAVPAIGPAENDLLECTAVPRTAQSRLSCQIQVSAALDGLTVNLPERQS